MMCPVCKRDLAPTLSICLTCGAMINDTVREELETKISRTVDAVTATSGKLSQPKLPAMEPKPIAPPIPKPPANPLPIPKQTANPLPQQTANPLPKKVAKELSKQPAAPPKPIASPFDTAELGIKKTSKTLVEFQTKKATVPEWRLQLQNSVRQKVGTNRRNEPSQEVTPPQARTTNGANALKVEFVEEEQPRHQNPRVANALKRIEESRRVFTNQRVPEQPVNIGKSSTPPRNFPFNVVAKSNETEPRSAGPKATVNASPKPMLVSSLKIEKKGYDTNKLPALQKSGSVSTAIAINAAEPKQINETERERWEHLDVDQNAEVEAEGLDLIDPDEIEDLAPLAMRFNAGLFDLIIGVFASLALLSPFMLSGGTWISAAGLLAIGASVAIVMFLYLTISLAFVGRTVGMRLFSLELVDVEENAYPTLHQAAVSSAVYLLSVALAGIGFLPILFNEERRAAHDILSGTILIREI